MEHQACMELVTYTLTELARLTVWPVTLFLVALVTAFVVPFWSRRAPAPVVDCVIIQDEAGQVLRIEQMQTGWKTPSKHEEN